MDLLQRQVQSLQLAQNRIPDPKAEANGKKKAAINKAQAKYDILLDEITELEGKVREVPDLSEKSNLKIGHATREGMEG